MKRLKIEILVLGILIGITLAGAVPSAIGKLSNAYEFFDTVVDVRGEVVRNFVEVPDEELMLNGAIRGMLEVLGDEHTSYLPPRSLESFDKATRGTFSGIGAEITQEDGMIKIVTPLEDSPAYKAGILAGDVVLTVDGTDVSGMSTEEAVDHITGPEGTEVVLTVRHTTGEEVEIPIIRGRIEMQTVKGFARDATHHWRYMLDEEAGIGYVRISQFSDPTADALLSAINEMNSAGMKGLIIDLRNNPGGLLNQAIEISDMFLSEGTIVSTQGRNSPEQKWMAEGGTTLGDFQIIAMVNESSASASEILSGALKDNDRAIVLGERSFGKGSVQQVLKVGRGAVKVTTALYYLPSGRSLHRKNNSEVWGVDPTDGFYVPMTIEQQRDMMLARREADVLRTIDGDAAPSTVSAEWVEENWKDIQLAKAIEAMHSRLETGEWVAVGESNATLMAFVSQKSELQRQRDFLSERLAEVNSELSELDRKVAAGEEIESTKASGDAATTFELDEQTIQRLENAAQELEDVEQP